MTLTIKTDEDEQRQLKLTVQVSEDRVEQAMRKKARQFASEVRVPGFRRGKVPYNVVLQRFGRELVRAEAVEDMIQNVYEEAVTEADIVPYGRPSLDDMEIEPLVLNFIIPLEPVVTLGDYRSLRKEIEEIDVTDEAVEEALEQVQTRHQEIESVDRPAELGDVVTVGGKGVLSVETDAENADADDAAVNEQGGDVLFDEESVDLLLDPEMVFAGTTFVESLVGGASGDELAFSITFPGDFEEEELAGKTAEFELHILDVKNREVPPVDDDLAKLEGDFETLEELREHLRQRLVEEAEEQLKEDTIESMVDDLLEDAALNYPPQAVEMEIDGSLQSFQEQVKRSGWDFADYLKLQNQTEETLREELRESSEERLRRQLAMRQFVLDEKLRIRSEDVETLVDERVNRYDNEELKNSLRDFYMTGAGFDMISSEVLSDKVYERITAILSGTAPELDELEDDEQTDEEE